MTDKENNNMRYYPRDTKKIRVDTNYYCEYELKGHPYKEMYELEDGGYKDIELYANGDLTMAIDHLGALEDVLQKYHIRNANELDKILSNVCKINRND